MSVSIETSGTGFKSLDADQECDDAAGREIYKNLRSLKEHELADVYRNANFEARMCGPPHKGEYLANIFIDRKVRAD